MGFCIGSLFDTRSRTIVVAASNSIDPTLAPVAYRCDGVADQVEINAAIAALGAVGGTVILLEGTYTLGAPISILLSNVTLRGNGPGSVLAGNPAGYFIEIGNNAAARTNVTVEKLRINGVDQTAGGGIWVRCSGDMYRIHIRFCVIENVFARGVYYDAAGTGTFHSQIIGNDIVSAGDAIYAEELWSFFIGSNKLEVTFTPAAALKLRASHYGVIEANFMYSQPTSNDTIYLDGCTFCRVIGNQLTPHDTGVNCAGTGYRHVIDGNTMNVGTQRGVDVNATNTEVVVSNNVIYNAGSSGVRVRGALCVIKGNIIYSSTTAGIEIQSANNVIGGNLCYDNADGILLSGEADGNVITGNRCTGNTYGINVSAATCDRNCIKDNNLIGNTTGAILDNGTSTMLATKTLQFQGGDATGIIIAQFISADASAKGWEIDAADEWAIALGQLPLEFQQIVRIKIWAVGLAAPGVGNKMRLEINMNAGQSDEAYTAEPITVANKPSNETNFDVNDVISWTLTSADDADIGDLIGGDSLEVKVKYEDAGNGDIATDAVFRCVEIEYV